MKERIREVSGEEEKKREGQKGEKGGGMKSVRKRKEK